MYLRGKSLSWHNWWYKANNLFHSLLWITVLWHPSSQPRYSLEHDSLPHKVQIDLNSLPCAAPSEDDLSSSINSCVLEQQHCTTPCQQVGPLSAVVPPQTLYEMLISQFQMFLWSDRPAGCWEKLSGGYGNPRTLIPSTTSNISIQCFQKTKWSQRAIKAS